MEKSILKDPLFWAGFLLAGLFLSFTLWFSLGMDQSLYCYIAWLGKHYHEPFYLGAWEHNFPGAILVSRLAMGLFGETILGFRIFDFLVQMSCLAMIFHLTQRLSGQSIAGFIACVFYGIYYYSLGSIGTAQRESFIFWILLMAVTLAGCHLNPWLRAALLGLLLGFAFLIKPTYGLAWPVFGVFILAQGIKARPGKVWQEAFLFSLCCFIPLLVMIFIFWQQGVLHEAYLAAIWFNSEVYSRMTDPHSQRVFFWAKFIPSFIIKQQPLLFFSALFAIAMEVRKGRSSNQRGLFWMLFSLMMIAIINYNIQGKYLPYQLAPFIGFLIIFSGAAFGLIYSRLKDVSGTGAGKIALWAACFGLFGLMVAQYDPWLREFPFKYCYRSLDKAYLAGAGTEEDKQLSGNYYEVAQYLKPLLKPGDNIACFGPYPLIPFLLKQKLPTRFACVQQLLFMRKDGKILAQQKEWIREYSTDTIKARPRFFIISDSFPGQNSRFFNFMTRDLSVALENQFPELGLFLKNNYHLKKVIGHASVYELSAKADNGTGPVHGPE